MNVNLLIDAIVRQTTVLVAQIATTAGTRATLANTANQVFQDLVRELRDQGLGNKVIADMFGLTLRNYHKRVRRLAESSTERGQSVWEAVLGYVRREGTVRRTDVLIRFARDDEAVVRSVLRDLVETGLVFATGTGTRVVYRAAEPRELEIADTDSALEGLADLVWVAVHHWGPLTVGALAEHVPATAEELEDALELLSKDGRVKCDGEGETAVWRAERYFIPLESASGWEAAVFDHYQAVVTAIATKLRGGSRRAAEGDRTGGSTYLFDLWPGHPHADEALAFLREARARAVALREKVEAFNATRGTLPSDAYRLLAYVGQAVLDDSEDEGDDR